MLTQFLIKIGSDMRHTEDVEEQETREATEGYRRGDGVEEAGQGQKNNKSTVRKNSYG